MILLLLFIQVAPAQVTDASFFPSVKSINPGIIHLRQDGFVALDVGKKAIEKKHDVPLSGVQDGINTDVALTKTTLFGAVKSRLLSGEVLVDKENGTREERINSTTRGNRITKNDASSGYVGGMLDVRFFGVSYANANYNFTDRFRVGNPPDLTARDEDQELKFNTLKVGTALRISFLRVGGYVLSQKATGSYTYTFYDPTTGNAGSTERFPVKTEAKGYGVGLGFTLPRLRSEVSLEKMYDTELTISEDYPRDVSKPTSSSRISVVGEMKLSFLSFGVRFRSIKGNYADLEDIISSNLLYQQLSADDTRTETSFNFSLSNTKGFSPSAFYTQSESTTKELSPVLSNGLKYKAVTKSKAYGVNVSYRF